MNWALLWKFSCIPISSFSTKANPNRNIAQAYYLFEAPSAKRMKDAQDVWDVDSPEVLSDMAPSADDAFGGMSRLNTQKRDLRRCVTTAWICFHVITLQHSSWEMYSNECTDTSLALDWNFFWYHPRTWIENDLPVSMLQCSYLLDLCRLVRLRSWKIIWQVSRQTAQL